jgi:hypothetical protein
MPAITRWSRRRVRVGAERRHVLVRRQVARREQLGPGPLLGAELAQPQLAAIGEPNQQAGALVAEGGAVREELEPPGGHEVDQERQVAEVDHGHLA